MLQKEYIKFNNKSVFNSEVLGKNKVFSKILPAIEKTFFFLS